MKVRELNPEKDMAEWLRLRLGLFDDSTEAEQRQEMAEILAEDVGCVLVAERPSTQLAGYAFVGSRKYAEGCTHSPVAYLEEWFVAADMRRQGVGKALIVAAEAWAQQNGFRELASDTTIDNDISLASHLALGFTEVERQINFIKRLE